VAAARPAAGSGRCPARRVRPGLSDALSSAGVVPLARPDPVTGAWYFSATTGQPNQEDQPDGDRPFLLDGALFQDRGAWGAYWHAILEDWRASGFSERMIVLERVGTAPRIPGLRYRALPAYRVEEAGRDAARLERVARRAAAQAVLTAVPTAAVETPLVAVVLALEWWLPASAAELAAAELCLAQASTIWVGDASLLDILLNRFPMLDPARISVIKKGARSSHARPGARAAPPGPPVSAAAILGPVAPAAGSNASQVRIRSGAAADGPRPRCERSS